MVEFNGFDFLCYVSFDLGLKGGKFAVEIKVLYGVSFSNFLNVLQEIRI